jgi:hypothetical protein
VVLDNVSFCRWEGILATVRYGTCTHLHQLQDLKLLLFRKFFNDPGSKHAGDHFCLVVKQKCRQLTNPANRKGCVPNFRESDPGHRPPHGLSVQGRNSTTQTDHCVEGLFPPWINKSHPREDTDDDCGPNYPALWGRWESAGKAAVDRANLQWECAYSMAVVQY